jgi:type IV pilus assembly protein PilM
MNQTLIYRDKPIFGMDIGHSSIKLMQIDHKHHQGVVEGYGIGSFDPSLIQEGMLTKPEELAQAANELFSKGLTGNITTRRVALSIPSAKTYTRLVSLPVMPKKDLQNAVRVEAEQYIPVAIDNLYTDYEIVAQSKEKIDILVVAAPKDLVESYLNFAQILGLEVVLIEPTIKAASRLFRQTVNSDVPTILIDFGSLSSDITIYDDTLVVTGTVAGGSEDFTKSIQNKLGTTYPEAQIIKTKYGLAVSKKQAEIVDALNKMAKEIQRMTRYYEDRNNDQNKKIGQIITLGGGANLPGLSEYLTDNLRLPVRLCDPWDMFKFHHIKPPGDIERVLFLTVAGLSLINPQEAFDD